MKYAIFGSWRDEFNKGSKTDFEHACFDLGKRLAERNREISVCSRSESTADYYVLNGALDHIKNKNVETEIVKIFCPSDDFSAFKSILSEFPKNIKTVLSNESKWKDLHTRVLNLADAVVIIGGSHYSYQAGIAGILSEKKVIPIGSFGGAGRDLIKIIKKETKNISPLLLDKLNEVWSGELLDYIIPSKKMEENEIPIPTITLEPSEEEILFNCLNDEGEFKKFVISNLIQTRKQISQLNFLFSEISSEMLEQILDRMDAHEFINYLKRESSSKSPEKLIENAIRNMNKYNFSQEKFEHFFKTLKQAIIIDQTMSIIFKLTTKEKFKKFLIEVAKFAVPDVVGKLIDEIIQLIR